MIFTDRTITVRKGESRIDEPIVVYRGDYELEVRFTILNSRFKFMSGTNMIESEKASYGQLAILTPYGGNIFSDIVRCNDGSVTFVLTVEMLNQIEEVGLYSFQIRLMDYNKESRVSIPPIEFGIEVREPIASEDHDNSVNNAIVGYSIAKVVDPKEENVGDTFDESGNYNKTKWETGDRISEGKLNKIEDAIDKINENEVNNTAVLSKRIDNNFNVLDAVKADKTDISSNMRFMGVVQNQSELSSINGVVGDYYYSSDERAYYMYSSKNKWECIGGGNYLDQMLETRDLVIENRYLNKNGIFISMSTNSFRTLVLPVVPKERYLICATYVDAQRIYAFVDEKGSVIEVYPNDQNIDIDKTSENLMVVVPENAVEIRVSSYGIGTITKAPIIDVDTELQQRVDNIETITDNLTEPLQLQLETKYVNFDGLFMGITNDKFKAAEFPVEPGEIYTITACYRDFQRIYSITDENGFVEQVYPNVVDDLPETVETVAVTIKNKGMLRISNYSGSGTELKVSKLSFNVNTFGRSKVIDSLCSLVTENINVIDGNHIGEKGNLVAHSDSFTTYELEVKAGEQYFVSGCYTESSRLYALLNESDNILSVYPDVSGKLSETFEHDVLVNITVNGTLRVSSYSKKIPITIKKYDLAISKADDIVNVTDQAIILTSNYIGSGGKLISLNSFTTYELEVKAGEQYFVSGSYIDASRLYSILDSNGTIISVYPDTKDNLPQTVEKHVEVNIMYDGVLRVSQYDKSEYVVIKQNTLGHDIPLPKRILDDLNFCSLMNKVLCIGDSLTRGAYYSSEYNGASIKENYPYYFSKLNQIEVTNAGQSGAYPSKWYTDKRPNYDIAAHDNFIIWLGTNNGLTDTLESDTAFDDYNNYAETETGYYCRIIENIQDLRPDANIFLCTVFASSGDKDITNTVLNQIASKYNLPLFDMDDGTIYKGVDHETLHPFGNNVHFGKVGNLALAQKLTLYINEYARSNPSILEKVYIK